MTLYEVDELRSVVGNLKSTAQRIMTETGSIPLHGRVYFLAERLEKLITNELRRRRLREKINDSR